MSLIERSMYVFYFLCVMAATLQVLTGCAVRRAPVLVTAAAPSGPAAPTNFNATPTVSTVQLFWSYTDNSISGFQIDRRRGLDANYINIARPNKQARGYLDSQVTAGTAYTYRLYATKGNNVSSPVFLMIMTDTNPQPPPQCTTVVTGNQVIFADAHWGPITAVSVNFLIDNVSIGIVRYDINEPHGGGYFTLNWNTATAVNGCHQVGAIASGELGDTGTALPITVKVVN